jgi:hypothetical protein
MMMAGSHFLIYILSQSPRAWLSPCGLVIMDSDWAILEPLGPRKVQEILYLGCPPLALSVERNPWVDSPLVGHQQDYRVLMFHLEAVVLQLPEWWDLLE